MSAIGLKPIGRFGNQLFQYAYARALAEQTGRELRTQPWIGQKVFQIDDAPLDGSEELLPENYRQTQADLIYSREDCRRWFTFRNEICSVLEMHVMHWPLVVHLRQGDYASCGYPVIGKNAVVREMVRYGFQDGHALICSETSHHEKMLFPPDLSFLLDFSFMMRARVLFRSNSTFSWWAATLGHARVFAPVITGLQGGMEHDVVPFVEGNWPRFVELDCVSDLHLRES